jgi:hypothetical protein
LRLERIRTTVNEALVREYRFKHGESPTTGRLRLEGAVRGVSPTSTGWSWHHVPGRPGVMQLVPFSQHKSGTPYQYLLHPDRGGGYQEWGRSY